MKEINILGIDLSKNIFQLHGTDSRGKPILKTKQSRSELKRFITNLKPCLIGMEACGGAHYWARLFRGMGHEVRLISPQFVKPYVKSNKNDAADAQAIAEAVSRPHMRFVSIKEKDHQDIQCLHRVRERFIRNKTALSNEIRGLLNEYGIILPKRIGPLKRNLPLIFEDPNNELSEMVRGLIKNLYQELKELEERITQLDLKVRGIYQTREDCQRIGKIEGVGPLIATAIISAVGNPASFKNGRQFSAWLGLVPKQHSSGGKEKLLGISKRGDRYIRALLIHGARSVLRHIGNKTDQRSRWVQDKLARRGYNKACVAFANKNARIIWAILNSKEEYRKAA